MGQKVNPTIFRVGVIFDSSSKWFSRDNYAQMLKEDILIRKFLKAKLKDSGIAQVEIKRSAKEIEIIVHTSRPGVIIGRGGANVEELKKEIKKKFFGNRAAFPFDLFRNFFYVNIKKIFGGIFLYSAKKIITCLGMTLRILFNLLKRNLFFSFGNVFKKKL